VTTICYRDGVLAADTAVNAGDMTVGTTVKIARAPDGTIGGAAGPLGITTKFLRWLQDGMIGEPPSGKEVQLMWVTPDGKVWANDGDGAYEMVHAYCAIGTGYRMAMGAMAFGATAREAVEVCCDLDHSTRRPITELALS